MNIYNKISLVFFFVFFQSLSGLFAQVPTDTTTLPLDENIQVDTVIDTEKLLQEVKSELEESRLIQVNLALELEQVKMQNVIADSIKLAEQKLMIDSLRQITPGIPVVIDEDTLFYIYSNRGGLSPKQRTEQTEQIIIELGKNYSLKPDSTYVLSEEFTSDIMYGEKVIISLIDRDALWMNTSRDELAEQYRFVIVDKLKDLKDKNSLSRLIKRIFLFILTVSFLFALIWLTNFGYKKLKHKLDTKKEKLFKPLFVREYELLSIERESKIMFFFLNVFRWIIIIVQLIIIIPILFSIFPQTENLAMTLFSYIATPVKSLVKSIINYIPNLFTIAVIWIVIRYVIKGIRFLAIEIESGRLSIPKFYPDWAKPTFTIIRFLLYAFMLIMIYPMLPGSNSPAFQGISVFLGLIVSFGSSSAIGNLISGIIITYMRPFKIGDRIKLNDMIGNVIERTPIVTRIKTLKNEIVTIPNSTIMNSQTTNLSESAKTLGLIIHLDVTMDYDTPWRQVNEILISSALATEGVMKQPHPFVLEQSFDDFYVTYQINAYIKDADQLTNITTALRENIQDKFKEAGLDITSPHYYTQKEEAPKRKPKNPVYKRKDSNTESFDLFSQGPV
ncbi:mechanosensitive ion channel family protein [Bacteroidales bacterium OttesenSCG-928-M11]|nr:mechanosensitive ion channel family protein [Bacteroidales bacterium OttesenSCG-928-M11]